MSFHERSKASRKYRRKRKIKSKPFLTHMKPPSRGIMRSILTIFIQKPNLLFKKNPTVLKKYQALFDAVLVDEWQDINPVQYEFVKLLAGEHRNLSVVGTMSKPFIPGGMPISKLF